MKSRFVWTVTALLALTVPLLITGSASAKTFKVNINADKPDRNPNNGKCETRGKGGKKKCSLRAAVQTANASNGADRIVINKGNLKLTRKGGGEDNARRGDLDVSSEISLSGRGTQLNAKKNDRAFDVLDGASLTVRQFKVFNGAPPETESGGAYRNAGELKLARQSVVARSSVTGEGASGGGVFNDGGDLTVRKSRISNTDAVRAGGAIEANGGTTVVDGGTILKGNSAGDGPGNGGALHLTGEGTVNVRDAEVVNNLATAEGGGLWNSEGGTMTVVRSTFEGNVAQGDEADQGGGALYNDGGTLAVGDDTKIAENVANGASGSGGGILNVGGTLSVDESRLIENLSNRAGGGIESNEGANSVTESDLIRNATGTQPGNGPGNGGGLHLTGAATLQVSGGTVRGNVAANEGGGLWNSGATMVVDGVSLRNNSASGADASNGGGGLYNNGGTLTVQNGTVLHGNAADGASGSGGGILNNGGSLAVTDATIAANSSNRAGGGIESREDSGSVALTDTALKGNATGSAPGNGGGLHITGAGNTTITGGNVFKNSAAREGGGLWNDTGTMTIDRTSLFNNTASGPASDDGGGALFNNGGTLVVQNGAALTGNAADGAKGSGGAIFNLGGSLTVADSQIAKNTAVRAGGGIEDNAGGSDIDSTTFLQNSAGDDPGNGGALHSTDPMGTSTITIDDSALIENAAANEGGGVWNDQGTMTVTNTAAQDNTAPTGPNAFNNAPGGVLTFNGAIVPPGTGT